MALAENFIDAIFYISKEDPPQGSSPSLRALLNCAFPTITFAPRDPAVTSDEFISVLWAGMECLAYYREDQYHYRLYLEFHIGDMYDNEKYGPLPDSDEPILLEEDPLLPIAVAFRETCELLRVDVAMLATRELQSADEALEENYWLILARSGTLLIRLHYALLYLSEDFCSDMDVEALSEQHDMLPADHGYLIFAGKGNPNARWI